MSEKSKARYALWNVQDAIETARAQVHEAEYHVGVVKDLETVARGPAHVADSALTDINQQLGLLADRAAACAEGL